MKRSYYGWLVVAAVFCATGVTVGTGQYAFGVFVKPLEGEFGWTRTQINAVLSLSAVAAFSGPIVGRILDRVGARLVMAFSLSLLGLSYALRPLMTEVWHWYALGILQALAVSGATMLPAGKLVGNWFRRTRGRMMGIAAMGNNFGGLTMTPLAALVVGAAGWRWGYGAFAILLAATAPLVYLAVRDRPEDLRRKEGPLRSEPVEEKVSVGHRHAPSGTGLTAGEAVRTRAFYIVMLGIMAASFTHAGVLPQLLPHLETEGLPLAQASLAISLFAAFGMVGKLLFGLLTERIPVRFALTLDLTLQAIGLLMLVRWANTPFLWAVMPFYGIAFGGVGALHPLLIQETFGVRHFGTISGIVSMAPTVSRVVGPLMVGALYDANGTYREAFMVMAAIFAVGAVVFPFARLPHHRTVLDLREEPDIRPRSG